MMNQALTAKQATVIPKHATKLSNQITKQLIFILIALSLTTTGCFSEQVKNPNMQSKLFNKQWNIQTLNQKIETESMFVSFNKEIDTSGKMTKHKIKVNGFSGCNRFFGTAMVSGVLSDNKIQFSPLAGTRKMCAKTMSFEINVLSKLASITSYKIEVKSAIETLYLYQNKTEVFSFTVKH